MPGMPHPAADLLNNRKILTSASHPVQIHPNGKKERSYLVIYAQSTIAGEKKKERKKATIQHQQSMTDQTCLFTFLHLTVKHPMTSKCDYWKRKRHAHERCHFVASSDVMSKAAMDANRSNRSQASLCRRKRKKVTSFIHKY